MGGVIHSADWWWQYFQNLYNIETFTITGTLTLGMGQYELSVPADFPNPAAVFLSVEEPPNANSTCVGDLNWVSARLEDNGFMLYADIQSASCTINYVVQYNTADTDPTKSSR